MLSRKSHPRLPCFDRCWPTPARRCLGGRLKLRDPKQPNAARDSLDINDINDPILDWVEELGGGYVWDAEVFAVNLLDVLLSDEDAERLSRLVGVQQIAVDSRRMSLGGLTTLARIPGISLLVIRAGSLTENHVDQLRASCENVQLID